MTRSFVKKKEIVLINLCQTPVIFSFNSSNAAVVPSVRTCMNLVNTIETTPLHISLSSLVDMLTMTRGFDFDFGGQKSRSQWTYMEISL